jgi:uncharacterized membrane protein
MTKNRLEAFSDGVLAIIITIMVLELKVPHGDRLGTLAPLVPVFMSYVLSFVYVGIYWNNHHHLLHACMSPLKAAIGSDWKGKLSPLVYVLGIVSTFYWSWVAEALYVAVALLWLVPDRRIERSLHRDGA